MAQAYVERQLDADELERRAGPLVLDFGTEWCGHCARARPLIEQAISEVPGIAHVRVEDGPGRPLGRRFRVKLWPTLVLLRDGKEIERLVRPADLQALRQALDRLRASEN
jgi:thioredoxin 1